MSDSKSNDPMIAALLRERANYVQAGRPERAEQVTAELARRGYKVKADDEKDTKDENGAPKGRRSPGPRSTAGEQE